MKESGLARFFSFFKPKPHVSPENDTFLSLESRRIIEGIRRSEEQLMVRDPNGEVIVSDTSQISRLEEDIAQVLKGKS